MDHTVVGDRVALDIGFPAAVTRLRILARGRALPYACELAYGQGVAALVGLAGPAAGLTRLADVCLEDLSRTDDCAHIALQWQAIAADGTLFTALLADLMLVPAGDQNTAVSLAGAFWPPPGRAGARLDQAIVRCFATVVIGTFLDSVACELVHPAGTADPVRLCLARGDGEERPGLGRRCQRDQCPAQAAQQVAHLGKARHCGR